MSWGNTYTTINLNKIRSGQNACVKSHIFRLKKREWRHRIEFGQIRGKTQADKRRKLTKSILPSSCTLKASSIHSLNAYIVKNVKFQVHL
jgi:hypothetical protein